MDLGQIIDMICDDIQHESDCATELRGQNPLFAAYRGGVVDGLRRAMVYLELLEANKNGDACQHRRGSPGKEINNLQ